MKSLLVRWAILSAAMWLSAQVLTGVKISGGAVNFIVLALVFGLVNATLGTLAKLLTFPVTLLTFGLWNLVVNAGLLLLIDNFNDALTIESIWWGLAMALTISVVNAILSPIKRIAKK